MTDTPPVQIEGTRPVGSSDAAMVPASGNRADVTATPEIILGLVKWAGIPEDQQATAAAIAMAESQANWFAHNPNPPDDSYGLWQINMLGNLGPDRRQKLGIGTNDALFNPYVNAKAMALISGGGNDWTPWSTFTSGAYKKYIPLFSQDGGRTVNPGDEGVAKGDKIFFGDATVMGPGGIVDTAKNVITAPLDFLKILADPNTWKKVAIIGGGILLIGGAIWLVVNKDGRVTEAATTAAKVAV